MYRLRISPEAKGQLKKAKQLYKAALTSVMEELKEDPFIGKPLTRELTGRFTFKVGPYRIVYLVNNKDKIIKILTFGHRSTVYKETIN